MSVVEVFDDVLYVGLDPGNGFGPEGVEEEEPYEVEPRHFRYDSPLVDWSAAVVEDREVDPFEAGSVACAPDHIGDVENLAILRQWPSVLDTGDPFDTRHSCLFELFGSDANQWR